MDARKRTQTEMKMGERGGKQVERVSVLPATKRAASYAKRPVSKVKAEMNCMSRRNSRRRVERERPLKTDG